MLSATSSLRMFKDKNLDGSMRRPTRTLAFELKLEIVGTRGMVLCPTTLSFVASSAVAAPTRVGGLRDAGAFAALPSPVPLDQADLAELDADLDTALEAAAASMAADAAAAADAAELEANKHMTEKFTTCVHSLISLSLHLTNIILKAHSSFFFLIC